MIGTPVGGLPPAVVVLVEGVTRGLGVRARHGHWQFGPNDDNTTNLGIGVSFPAGESRATVEVGHTTKKGCSECGAILVGAELHVPLATAPLSATGTGAEDGPTFGAPSSRPSAS
ncbi:MAG: hypothetical protein LJF06_11705 [Gemmatimonadetes bacterium]|nr:hypothetical protein [Gemmatimonadota bacterium]